MILGISGKIGSGKDTVGKIIQYLVWKSRVEKGELPLSVYSFSDFARETSFGKNQSGFEIKKYADKLKDMVCMLIGCTRKQLEDREFKEKELGEEWWYTYGRIGNVDILVSYLDMDKEFKNSNNSYVEKLTPRELLQIIGTDCIRDKVHPNAWVNALFADYKGQQQYIAGTPETKYPTYIEYPNWIITDMRFPNELEAVKSRGGITIRVNRPCEECGMTEGHKLIPHKKQDSTHPSETALDNAEFDYIINNDSSIEDLIHTVSLILTKEKII